MIFPFLRKAVAAGKVAVMGNMQAQRLYHRLPVLEIPDIIFVNILRKQMSGFIQLQNFFYSFLQLLFCIRKLFFRELLFSRLLSFTGALRFQRCKDTLFFFYSVIDAFLNPWYHIIDTIVHNMYASAVHIHYDVVAVVFVLVYHWKTSFLFYRNCPGPDSERQSPNSLLSISVRPLRPQVKKLRPASAMSSRIISSDGYRCL